MANVSFVKTADEIKHFASGENAAWLNNSEGIFTVWATNQETIQKVLPAPLQAIAPVVTSYVINVHEPTFSTSYKEAALIVPCAYKGQPAAYALSMLLDGTDNGVFTGREELGIPKKNAQISLCRVGDKAKAKVERYGTTVFEVECEIGSYNTPNAQAIFGDRSPGTTTDGTQIFYKFDIDQDEQANVLFSNLRLLEVKNRMVYHSWEPAAGTVKLQPSVNDPWAELPVLQVLGSAWTRLDAGLLGAKATPMDNIAEVLPYILTRYDSPVFGHPNRML